MPDRTTRTRRQTRVGFDTTNWTIVMTAVNQNLPGSSQALEQLCQKYWRPVYAFLRQQGHPAPDAQDLTQGFFVHLLQANRLCQIHPSKGRLRSFLLAALQNYVLNQRDWARAQKRGGGRIPVPLENVEPIAAANPAAAFDQHWASVIFAKALNQLRQSSAVDGKGKWFDAMRPFLTSDSERGDYATLAAEWQTTERALRTAISRLRAEFRDALRAEVAKTVTAPGDVEEELRYLLSLAHDL